MVFPTIKNLEPLARFDTADELLEWARTHEVKPVAAARRGPRRDRAASSSTMT